jgi:hypothetical protein
MKDVGIKLKNFISNLPSSERFFLTNKSLNLMAGESVISPSKVKCTEACLKYVTSSSLDDLIAPTSDHEDMAQTD